MPNYLTEIFVFVNWPRILWNCSTVLTDSKQRNDDFFFLVEIPYVWKLVYELKKKSKKYYGVREIHNGMEIFVSGNKNFARTRRCEGIPSAPLVQRWIESIPSITISPEWFERKGVIRAGLIFEVVRRLRPLVCEVLIYVIIGKDRVTRVGLNQLFCKSMTVRFTKYWLTMKSPKVVIVKV